MGNKNSVKKNVDKNADNKNAVKKNVSKNVVKKNGNINAANKNGNNNTTTNQTVENPENNQNNVQPNPENQQPPVEVANMSDEDKAKELAKRTYGTADGVYFRVEQVESNGVYIISVRDLETTKDLAWYTVNVKTGSVKQESELWEKNLILKMQ